MEIKISRAGNNLAESGCKTRPMNSPKNEAEIIEEILRTARGPVFCSRIRAGITAEFLK